MSVYDAMDEEAGAVQTGEEAAPAAKTVDQSSSSSSSSSSSTASAVAAQKEEAVITAPAFVAIGGHGSGCSPNSKTLVVSMVLFGTITTAQVFAAIAANSNALLADCVSMGVDTLSYVGNLGAECSSTKDKRVQQKRQLLGSGISLTLLLGFTFSFLFDAIATITNVPDCQVQLAATVSLGSLLNCTLEAECAAAPCAAPQAGHCSTGFKRLLSTPKCICCQVDPEVNPYIVFVFALFGLLFDLGSLVAFHYFGKKSMEERQGEAQTKGEQLNMRSAFLHVLADCLRSTSTLVESLLIFSGVDVPSYVLDGWATLIICVSILLGGFVAAWEWLGELKLFIWDTPPLDEMLTGEESNM